MLPVHFLMIQAAMTTATRAFCLLFLTLGMGLGHAVFAADNKRAITLAQIAEHPARQAPATAVSLNHTTLSAQLQATVTAIPVGVSQQVKKGETLLQLDCTDFNLALQLAEAGITIAKARLDLAKTQQDRAAQLMQKDLTSRESLDTANAEAIARQAEQLQARINLQRAQLDVKRCQIKAPFDGIITQRIASVGQLAAVGTPLITIVDTRQLELSALIKPHEVSQLQQAALAFVADQSYPVTLLRSGGIVNTETRDQEIRLAFRDQAPPPGTAGKLVWTDPRSFVPAQYVVKREGQWGVFIKQEGKARFIALPNAIPGRSAPLELAEDTLIVVKGLGPLNSGDPLP
ncbi:MAG: efflux RND transporter periplasmic adaptor subunit [Ketobacter sp.]|nr:MAG: efflux RND transporter periplasmic adaptor subunit [Ketobacter sp.]